MKKEYAREYLLENRGCYGFSKAEALSFMSKDVITLKDIVDSDLPRKDVVWHIMHNCFLTDYQKTYLALRAFWILIPVFRELFPRENRLDNYLGEREYLMEGLLTKDQFDNNSKSDWVHEVRFEMLELQSVKDSESLRAILHMTTGMLCMFDPEIAIIYALRAANEVDPKYLDAIIKRLSETF